MAVPVPMSANNAPLRGFKQMDYEGGVHVPFIVSWPAQAERRKNVRRSLCGRLICLPPLSTPLAFPCQRTKPLDGKSILPALKGETEKLHDEFYWSSAGEKGKWAIRSGNWKLVAEKKRIELFDLKKDLSETTDLAAKHPKVVSELTAKYNAWLDEMADPVSKQEKRWNLMVVHPPKMSKKEKKSSPRKKRKPSA